jgi:HEPN domain-containing protein
MPTPHDVRDVVRQWLRKADHDLLNAATMLEIGDRCPTDTVCFHAQ